MAALGGRARATGYTRPALLESPPPYTHHHHHHHTLLLLLMQKLAHNVDAVTREVRIALVGKYTGLQDSYLSVIKALQHAAIAGEVRRGEGREHDASGVAPSLPLPYPPAHRHHSCASLSTGSMPLHWSERRQSGIQSCTHRAGKLSAAQTVCLFRVA
jgi:hypothetical protein